MSWRVVIISKRAKLDFKMSFLVIRNEDGEKRIFIGDIAVLMIESTAVSITAYLMTELIKRKIKIIFCDDKHNPCGEVVSESFYLDFNQNIANLERFLTKAIYEEQFTFDVSLSEPSAENLVKLLNPKINQSSVEYLETLYQYLEAITELTEMKLFIILGLSNFFNLQEYQDISNFCNNHEIPVFSIETSNNFAKELVCPKIIVDEDFCII